ncbi:MAG: hypothetical protein HDR88_10470 [Bacteroides sp.]|nr:hypothetical protein [Bacteroides sp.]
MGFTSRCAIHDSNPRIWRKLIHFGLHPNACSSKMTARNNDNQLCTVVEGGSFYLVKECNLPDYVYDCDDNEESFFALAALRDDSDIYQWFIYDNRDWNDEDPERYWFVCKQDSIEDDMFYDAMYADCEKATEAELKLHFNDGDDDTVIENLQ